MHEEPIKLILNKIHVKNDYISPEFAIKCILDAGGIPVLAHPKYGDGDQTIEPVELDKRVKRLKEKGLKGLEAYYSGFSPEIIDEIISLAEKYDLYITAGSDYHGKNKQIKIGDTWLSDINDGPECLKRLLKDVAERSCIMIK